MGSVYIFICKRKVYLNNGLKVKCWKLKIRKKNSGLKEVVCVMYKIWSLSYVYGKIIKLYIVIFICLFILVICIKIKKKYLDLL